MNARDPLRVQFGILYRIVEQNVNGMTADQSVAQPSPGGNCANWILAHMLVVHNSVMQLVGEAPAWDNPELERAREDPITGAGESFDWDELRSRFAGSRDRMLAGLEKLTDAQLDEPLIDPFGEQNTRGGLLSILALHQNYHAGQLGLARRLVGLPGAIRAPQPQSAS